MKLSDLAKTSNVKQFSAESDETKGNDYKPPRTGYIRFFSSVNGTQVKKDSVDGGVDFEFISSNEPTVIKEVTDEELDDFVKYLNHMASLGQCYNYIDFYTVNDESPVRQFSVKIKEYLKEKLKNPRVAFLFRVRQFITYMNRAKPEILGTTMYYAVQYIKEYFEQYLTAAMNGIVNPNILMGLGISRFIANKQSVRLLQKWLRRSAQEIERQGAMTKIAQKKLWDSFRDVFIELMTGISYKIKDPIKRDLLVSAVSGTTRNIETVNDMTTGGIEDEETN